MTTQFFDLMIDVECADKKRTGALMAVGGVFFDLQTCTLGPTFSRTINLVSSVAHGGTMDASTMLWWMRQGDAARKAVAYGGEPLDVVLNDLSTWIAQTCRHEDVRLWGNNDEFDIPKLENGYRGINCLVPWYWSHVRDFRTVRNMNPQVEYNPADKDGTAHNALDDAVFQAEFLFKIKRSRMKNHA
jgi:hypothetical protein